MGATSTRGLKFRLRPTAARNSGVDKRGLVWDFVRLRTRLCSVRFVRKGALSTSFARWKCVLLGPFLHFPFNI